MRTPNATRRIILATCASVALLAGCSETKEAVKPEPAALTTDPSAEWVCPSNTSGAKMVLIPVDEGKPYCIDQREGTNSEYREFLAAKSGDFRDQPPECAWNKDYGPAVTAPEPGCPDCPPIKYGPPIEERQPDHAVFGVDFCDAWAFCSWAGKRLCGLRGAAPGKVTTIHLGDDPDSRNNTISESIGTVSSEWFNVCSQGGTTKYPYGDERQAGTCIDSTKIAAKGESAWNVGVLSESDCHGSIPPYDQVYNMSGSYSVWANTCFQGFCASVGGPLDDELLSCAGSVGITGLPDLMNGVRCCADAVRGTAVGVE